MNEGLHELHLELQKVLMEKQEVSKELQKTLKQNKALAKAFEGVQRANAEVNQKLLQCKSDVQKCRMDKEHLEGAFKAGERTQSHELRVLHDRINQLDKERAEFKDGLEKTKWKLGLEEQMKLSFERELGKLKRDHSKQTADLMDAVKAAQHESLEVRQLKDKVKDASKLVHSMKDAQDVLLVEHLEEVRHIKTVAEQLKQENESIKTQHRHVYNNLIALEALHQVTKK